MNSAARKFAPVRVGFVLGSPGAEWLGGLNYFVDLLCALRESDSPDISPVVLLATGTSHEVVAQFVGSGAEVHCIQYPTRTSPLGVFRNRALMRRHILRCVAEYRLDMLSHSPVIDTCGSIPTISWIPDFQHIAMPQHFSWRTRMSRWMEVRRVVRYSTCALLSSESAQMMLCKISIRCAKKSAVLRFRKRAVAENEIQSADQLCAQYQLPGDFFYLPNQFWVHKDHEVVIRALALLRQEGYYATVVCTGSAADYRDSGHFSRIKALVEALKLQSQFLLLGMIPRSNCWALMRHAIAVLNPSRFEGWSSTVEEARALGVTTILSDIDVHREQSPEGCVFFRAGDPVSLAERLKHALNAARVDRPRLDAEFGKFGREYAAIVRETHSKALAAPARGKRAPC